MKSVFRKTLLAAATAASLFTLSTAANACSRLVWETDNHGVFVSRTMDWMEANHPTVEVRAAGQSYKGHDSNNGKTWTSKYASIGMTLYGVGIVDGFNEVGFSANALFLDEEVAGNLDKDKDQVLNAILVAYLLDNFATVKEALANLDTLEVQQFEHNGIA
ncbi:choloylglycine hydrolase family [Vibrio ishigakensis]|uniref:Choloylglycine hydrolase family n=1 Tax=Vibrio ishigakensis TaxID=1481914 RepID=A0A0B8PB11_9VIBR|nr:choloylglycine hydrolase family [Vibrio ishigakensis]